jgi:hypothetical protein
MWVTVQKFVLSSYYPKMQSCYDLHLAKFTDISGMLQPLQSSLIPYAKCAGKSSSENASFQVMAEIFVCCYSVCCHLTQY